MEKTHYEALLIGGGNAGISLAARLERKGVQDVAVVEPKDQHPYQPLFSHIAGGRAMARIPLPTRPRVSPAPRLLQLEEGHNGMASTAALHCGFLA